MKKKAKTKRKSPSRRPLIALDRFDLYELCVQSPEYDARMLDAIHGHDPRVLGEDFCGTAALSRAWVDLGPKRSAVAVDHDPTTIERALASNSQRSPADPRRRVDPRTRIDYLLADVRNADDRADLIAVLNYAIGEFHTRAALVGYLTHARSRLRKRGVFLCDIYTGNDAFLTGELSRTFDHPAGHEVIYAWDQREANPLTGMVENSISFKVRQTKETIPDAFVYHWRLWSIPELREAMLEAGFNSTLVYPRSAEAISEVRGGGGVFHVEHLEDPNELPDSFSCYVVGRV